MFSIIYANERDEKLAFKEKFSLRKEMKSHILVRIFLDFRGGKRNRMEG
jgi:hypothetical protein